MFGSLKHERGVKAVVVTIKSIHDYDIDETTIDSSSSSFDGGGYSDGGGASSSW